MQWTRYWAALALAGICSLASAQGPAVMMPRMASADPHALQTRMNPIDGQAYVWIAAGSFMLGCSPGDEDCLGEEQPAHRVTLTKGYWIGQTVVTVGAWRRYRLAGGLPALPSTDSFGRSSLNEAAGNEQMPAVLMDWQQASDFCRWAGGQLPTEAQWEFAARAGHSESRPGPLEALAWYADNSGRSRIDSAEFIGRNAAGDAYDQLLLKNGNGPHPVRQKSANDWGLYDLFGSVSQWTADWFDRTYYEQQDGRDPRGPSFSDSKFPQRVVRGNSWDGPPDDTRVSRRGRVPPAERRSAVGLRCVTDATGAFANP